MFLGFFLEVVLICILAGVSYYGYRRGLFRIIVSPLRRIISFLLAFSFSDYVARAFVCPLIRTPVKSYLTEILLERTNETDLYIPTSNLPPIVKIVASLCTESLEAIGSAAEISIERILEGVSEPLLLLISRLIAFILLYLLFMILIRLGVSLLDSIFCIGVIERINRSLGLMLSFVLALFCAWAFASLADYLFRLDLFSESDLAGELRLGPLYTFFREFSPIRLILTFNFL